MLMIQALQTKLQLCQQFWIRRMTDTCSEDRLAWRYELSLPKRYIRKSRNWMLLRAWLWEPEELEMPKWVTCINRLKIFVYSFLFFSDYLLSFSTMAACIIQSRTVVLLALNPSQARPLATCSEITTLKLFDFIIWKTVIFLNEIAKLM